MPDSQIIKLFSIKVTHDFYSDGLCDDFTFCPSTDCYDLMRKYKMFLRRLQNGIEVYYEADSSGTPVKQIQKEEKLVFYMRLNNKMFYNYTDIPDENIYSKIFFLTNKQSVDSDSLNLFAGASAIGDSDYIDLKPQRFTVEEKSATQKVQFKLIDMNDEVIKQSDPIIELIPKESDSDPDEYQTALQVDLQNKKSGKYVLKMDETPYLTFYSDDVAFNTKCFGIIEIYKSSNTTRAYQLVFTKKSCYWKYIIVPKYQTDITISKLQINSTKSFASVVSSSLDDGTNVGIIESSDEIEFSDTAISAIKLQLQGSGNQLTTLMENLPNPDPANLKIDKNTNKVYSEVFVYI